MSGCDSIGDKLVDSLLARTSAATAPHKLEVTVSEMSFSERGRKELERLAERSSGLEVFFVTSARDNEEIFSGDRRTTLLPSQHVFFLFLLRL